MQGLLQHLSFLVVGKLVVVHYSILIAEAGAGGVRRLGSQHLHEPRVTVGYPPREVLLVVLVFEGEFAELKGLRDDRGSQELGLP